MKRQTYKGPVAWIIVDDCVPRTTDIITEGFRDNWIVIKKYPKPSWGPGLNTQGRNISVGVNTLLENYDAREIEAIFIIEDDDYYSPAYIEKMIPRLNGFQVAGETNTIYYNVFFRRHITNNNRAHASLFQIAFTPEAISTFRMCYESRFIDAQFFKMMKGQGVNLFRDGDLAIGIKGMPGRFGIGAGHGRLMNMRADINLQHLIKLIGPQDAKLYERYYGGNHLQRKPLFSSNRH
jgi:hypothetical protein